VFLLSLSPSIYLSRVAAVSFFDSFFWCLPLGHNHGVSLPETLSPRAGSESQPFFPGSCPAFFFSHQSAGPPRGFSLFSFLGRLAFLREDLSFSHVVAFSPPVFSCPTPIPLSFFRYSALCLAFDFFAFPLFSKKCHPCPRPSIGLDPFICASGFCSFRIFFPTRILFDGVPASPPSTFFSRHTKTAGTSGFSFVCLMEQVLTMFLFFRQGLRQSLSSAFGSGWGIGFLFFFFPHILLPHLRFRVFFTFFIATPF